ncbi:RNA-binding protein 40 [Agrilus planipennis]|uniref:RNA-binding region-containing protein 3 n=1 Tax=Agrilus planipennis TaxID=224129 RepID=A0A1W4XHB1_AGRPL|nr:RNA-binding protein 40 [Agrilus planipennis]
MVCDDTLKIRNFPKELTNAEKEDLLRHFGASDIKIITSKAKQKSVVFAKFSSKEVAKNVLLRLHQLNVLNSRLVVEYAEHDIAGKTQNPNIELSKTTEHNSKKYLQSFINKLNAFNNSVSFYQPPASHLKYVYPKPNRATINNIAHALASIPKFYTQVLHLMNRMNLPPPFSDVPDPPQVRQPIVHPVVQNKTELSEQNVREESSESEIESDPECSNQNKGIIPEKRKMPQKKTVKRPKFIKPNVAVTPSSNKSVGKAEDVFERIEIQSRKIEVKVSSDNFDIPQPKPEVTEKEEDIEETVETPKSDMITEEELNANRIPAKDLGVVPVYKNYHCGAPSSRLYIKNIAKNVEEKDLEYIYKRYCVEDNNKESTFDIKLMKEGRMKGQAFVTLNSVQTAQRALKETNGFILKDKPLVVVYARSATTTNKK